MSSGFNFKIFKDGINIISAFAFSQSWLYLLVWSDLFSFTQRFDSQLFGANLFIASVTCSTIVIAALLAVMMRYPDFLQPKKMAIIASACMAIASLLIWVSYWVGFSCYICGVVLSGFGSGAFLVCLAFPVSQCSLDEKIINVSAGAFMLGPLILIAGSLLPFDVTRALEIILPVAAGFFYCRSIAHQHQTPSIDNGNKPAKLGAIAFGALVLVQGALLGLCRAGSSDYVIDVRAFAIATAVAGLLIIILYSILSPKRGFLFVAFSFVFAAATLSMILSVFSSPLFTVFAHNLSTSIFIVMVWVFSSEFVCNPNQVKNTLVMNLCFMQSGQVIGVIGAALGGSYSALLPTEIAVYCLIIAASIVLSIIYRTHERTARVEMVDQLAQAHQGLAAKFSLTTREAEIMALMMRGKSRRDISEELHISLETVKTHIRHIYDKLQIHSREELTGLLLSSVGESKAPEDKNINEHN